MLTAYITFNNSTFCPHSVFMCFVWISEQTAIICLYSINWLVFITERLCVYCAVRAAHFPTQHSLTVPSPVLKLSSWVRDSHRGCGYLRRGLSWLACKADICSSSCVWNIFSALASLQVLLRPHSFIYHRCYAIAVAMPAASHWTPVTVSFNSGTSSVLSESLRVSAEVQHVTHWQVRIRVRNVHGLASSAAAPGCGNKASKETPFTMYRTIDRISVSSVSSRAWFRI
jgi:hypothetical protein